MRRPPLQTHVIRTERIQFYLKESVRKRTAGLLPTLLFRACLIPFLLPLLLLCILALGFLMLLTSSLTLTDRTIFDTRKLERVFYTHSTFHIKNSSAHRKHSAYRSRTLSFRSRIFWRSFLPGRIAKLKAFAGHASIQLPHFTHSCISRIPKFECGSRCSEQAASQV